MSRESKTSNLAEIDLDSVNGGLNALMLPLGAVMATLAALDRDEFWIPYFTNRMIEADK
jgi:hypothetical protein